MDTGFIDMSIFYVLFFNSVIVLNGISLTQPLEYVGQKAVVEIMCIMYVEVEFS